MTKQVQQPELVGDVFERYVIGNNIALQAYREVLAEGRFPVQEEPVISCGDVQVAGKFAFRSQSARVDRLPGTDLAEIIRQLAVQETKTVPTHDAKFGSAGQIDEHLAGEI